MPFLGENSRRQTRVGEFFGKLTHSARVREFSLCVPLALVVLILAVYCVAQLLHPAHTIPAQPPMCFLTFSFFRILFLCDKCCRRCQNTYGERRRLLLQLLVLQPCMEGMVLGVPT